jgi:hypothetical protein
MPRFAIFSRERIALCRVSNVVDHPADAVDPVAHLKGLLVIPGSKWMSKRLYRSRPSGFCGRVTICESDSLYLSPFALFIDFLVEGQIVDQIVDQRFGG